MADRDGHNWWDYPGELSGEGGSPWWNEIRKTRQYDSSGKLESGRHWAERLGVSAANVIGWHRGALPRAATVKKICQRLRLPMSEYSRLMSVIQGVPLPVAAREVPLYEGTVTVGPDGQPIGTRSGMVTLGEGVARESRASRELVAVRLKDDDDSMEPAIPRGSIVYVDLLKGKENLSFESGATYAVIAEPDLCGLSVTYVVRGDEALWLVPANPRHRARRSWTDDPSQLIAGRAFHFQGAPTKLRPGYRFPFEQTEDGARSGVRKK